MYCFANNLPIEADRGPAEAAVVAGIGDHAGDVEHYSIVVAQTTSVLQVQIKLKGRSEPLFVNLADNTPDGVRNGVAAALAGL